MITSHYFDAALTDPQGRPITPARFRTLQAAMLFADDQDCEVTGTIFYVEDPALPAEPVIHYLDGQAEGAKSRGN
ncbi:hypothetical protein [Mycolicibacterium sp. D5.8-2]|uniref:hypothetical protein n=1 Tax=Mycolicibacterium sp. D5.8-2 TaxID=3085903 RepID=UPI00298C88CD|nr:hypothetical protein [Mycolicibacterium sp. D5.8-2]MDW5610659.1 hypothetical protein [Mycolicibacterium sp. D5.8-2]